MSKQIEQYIINRFSGDLTTPVVSIDAGFINTMTRLLADECTLEDGEYSDADLAWSYDRATSEVAA